MPRARRGLVDLIDGRDAEGLHPRDEQRVVVIGRGGFVRMPVPNDAQVRTVLVMLLVGFCMMVCGLVQDHDRRGQTGGEEACQNE